MHSSSDISSESFTLQHTNLIVFADKFFTIRRNNLCGFWTLNKPWLVALMQEPKLQNQCAEVLSLSHKQIEIVYCLLGNNIIQSSSMVVKQTTIEVWAWVSNYIPYKIMDVITYPCSKCLHPGSSPLLVQCGLHTAYQWLSTRQW